MATYAAALGEDGTKEDCKRACFSVWSCTGVAPSVHAWADVWSDSGSTLILCAASRVPARTDLQIAEHYEKAKDPANAGKYYAICHEYLKAVKLFLQCDDTKIDDAIAVVSPLFSVFGWRNCPGCGWLLSRWLLLLSAKLCFASLL